MSRMRLTKDALEMRPRLDMTSSMSKEAVNDKLKDQMSVRQIAFNKEKKNSP